MIGFLKKNKPKSKTPYQKDSESNKENPKKKRKFMK
jgi:hypothetical protein